MEEDALLFAEEAHGDQKRKYSGEPYVEHLKRVAATVKTVPHTPEMIAAALLHDVVEDTPIELEEIARKFGGSIAKLVEELTDEFIKEDYPHLNRKQRKAKEVARQASMSPDAKTIKLADVIDNTMDIVRNDPGFGRRYVREMDALVGVLQQGDPELIERARQEIIKGKKILKMS